MDRPRGSTRSLKVLSSRRLPGPAWDELRDVEPMSALRTDELVESPHCCLAADRDLLATGSRAMDTGRLTGDAEELEDVFGAVRECVPRRSPHVCPFSFHGDDPRSVAVDEPAKKRLDVCGHDSVRYPQAPHPARAGGDAPVSQIHPEQVRIRDALQPREVVFCAATRVTRRATVTPVPDG
jgi:hypothetical protein